MRRRMEIVTGLLYGADTSAEYFQVVIFLIKCNVNRGVKNGTFLRLLTMELEVCIKPTPTMSFTLMSDQKIKTHGTCMSVTELLL